MPKEEKDKSSTGIGDVLTASCTSCRERKVKCDSAKPRCGICQKNPGRECSYRPKQKPGLKAGAGSLNLETRVVALEKMITEQANVLTHIGNLIGLNGRSGSASSPFPFPSQRTSQPFSPIPSNPSATPNNHLPTNHFPNGLVSSNSLPHPQSYAAQNHSTSSANIPSYATYQQQHPQSSLPSAFNDTPLAGSSRSELSRNGLDELADLATAGGGRRFDRPPERSSFGSGHANPDVAMNDSIVNHGNSLPPMDPRPRAFDEMVPGRPPVHDTSPFGFPRHSAALADWPTAPPSIPPKPTPPVTSVSAPILSHRSSSHIANPVFQATDLPPTDVIQELIDIYFERINPWACLLVRTDLAIENAAPSPATPSSTSSRPRQPSLSLTHLTTGSSAHPRPSILVYAIVAISLRFSSHPHFTPSGPQSKESYQQLAKNHVVLRTMGKMSAEGLKALALLALDAIEDGRGPGGWGGILSLLTGGVSHGGLGEEEEIARTAAERKERKGSGGSSSKGSEYVSTTLKTTFISETKDWREIEERRRLFWFTYFLDRYASVSTGWDFAFRDDDDERRRLPSTDESWMHGPDQDFQPFVSSPPTTPPSTLSSPPTTLFGTFVQIVRLLGRIHQFIRQPLDISSQRETQAWHATHVSYGELLTQWYSALPLSVKKLEREGLPDPDGQDALRVVLLGFYYATTIRLYSASAYPPYSSAFFRPQETAGHTCVEASKSMSRVALLVGMRSRPRAGGLGGHDVETTTGIIDIRDVNPALGWCLWVCARGLVAHSIIKETPLDSSTAIFVETLRNLSQYWSSAKNFAKILTSALQYGHKLKPNPAFQHLLSEPLSEIASDLVVSKTINILRDMKRTAWSAASALKEDDADSDENDSASSDPSLRHAHQVSNVRGSTSDPSETMHQVNPAQSSSAMLPWSTSFDGFGGGGSDAQMRELEDFGLGESFDDLIGWGSSLWAPHEVLPMSRFPSRMPSPS